MDKKLAEMTLEEAWQLAIRKEQEAQELYRTLAEKGKSRELFLFLLEQEKGHEQRLQDEYDQAFRQDW